MRRRPVSEELVNFFFVDRIISQSLPKLFSFPQHIFGISFFRSRCHFERKTAKILSKPVTTATQKREDLFSFSAWSRDCVNNWSHGREKKNIKLKIDLLNKIFPLICNTQIPNNLQILCLTSINCLFFLFSNSWNRIISKLFTFSKKQPQENEAIQLTIIILSLNNRKSWKCFNSRLPNTPPKFSVQRNTTCYNVVATSCRTVVTFLSSSDKREVNVRSQSRTSCFYFEYLELHNFISLPLKLETPQRRLCIRRNESSTQIKWKNSIHALICNNVRSELNYCKPLWSLGMMPLMRASISLSDY